MNLPSQSQYLDRREAIMRAFREAGRPLSPAEVLQLARRYTGTLGIATVYRYIHCLLQDKWLTSVGILTTARYYEIAETGRGPSQSYFTCAQCNHIYRLIGTSSLEAVNLPQGFHVSKSTIIIHGLCSTCNGTATPESE